MIEVKKVWGIKYPNDPDYKGVDLWATEVDPDNDFFLGPLPAALWWFHELDAVLGLYSARDQGKWLRMTAPGHLSPRPSPFYIHPDGSRTEHTTTVSNVPPNYTFAGYTDFGAVQVPRYEDMEHSGKRLMDAWWKLADTAASMLPKPTSKCRQIALAHDILDMLQ